MTTGDDRTAGGNPSERPEKPVVQAKLIADTRSSEEQLGFRNAGARERRMLFQAEDAYIELLVPNEGHESLDGGWLYGQFITPTTETAERFKPPLYASLVGDKGCTGAARLTAVGDFAVPFWDAGAFKLHIEPSEGPVVQVNFTH